MLTKIPDLLGVIDHLAKPNIQDNCLQPWKTHITEIAKYPGLHCKLSGMFPRANPSIDISKQVQPFVSHLLRCFGEDRLMFGSDWPVCLTSSDYKSSIEVIKKTVSCHLSTKVETAIFGGNAIKFYRLDGAEK
jgi:L-fuconolactonase